MDKFELEDDHNAMHIETTARRQSEKSDVAVLKLDKHGFPLVPQPSEHKMDPLNWSTWLKVAILIQISAVSFLSLLAASLIVSPLHLSNIIYV
jgi:hypothetical protein